MVNMVPNNPPRREIIRVGTHSISIHNPATSSAGIVKITPAAKDSPALAIVCTELFSKMLTSSKSNLRIIIDITAAGIDAETVIPA